MKKSILVVSLSLPILASLIAWKGASEFPKFVTNKKLYAKNDFRGKEFKTLQFGKVLSGEVPAIKDLKGKVILIDFWATWCGPCRAVIPELNDWKAKFAKDLIIVGVSNEKPEVVQEFMKTTKMEYAVTTDQEKTMSKILGVEGIPHVLVISQDGIVRYQGFPSQEEDKLTTEKLEQIIKANRDLK
jgi:cytochrome c biogenesis protein CcmG, thiol:disulfide interchange protein DsbE